jgi:TetR/AcrR family transcriptional regulator, regulator of cefoperazone and chloramphenicol sensitivity
MTEQITPPLTTRPAPAPAEARKPRSDGEQSRQRLLQTAIRLFAERGYANASTREIALAAGANSASIRYYFGDKAGLYRAAFTERSPVHNKNAMLFTQPGLTLRQALQHFYDQLLVQMKQGELAQSCLRLWFREMLEPTGLWAEEIDQGIRPAHAALTALLARHLGLEQADDDLYRLAFGVVGLGLQPMMTSDVVVAIRPQLLDGAPAIDAWTTRLAGYAEAMVGFERIRRQEQA